MGCSSCHEKSNSNDNKVTISTKSIKKVTQTSKSKNDTKPISVCSENNTINYIETNSALIWTNKAGVSWMLLKESENYFKCINCPYPNLYISFVKDDNKTKSFEMGSEVYFLISATSGNPYCGIYEKQSVENDWHSGEITQYNGKLNPVIYSKDYLVNSFAWNMLKPFGLQDSQVENYANQIITIETFFKLESMLRNKEYPAGYKLVEDYFSTIMVPTYLDYNLGMNFGTPVGLYSLLMLKKIFEFYKTGKQSKMQVDYYFTIVLVGKSHGAYPNSVENVNDPSALGEIVHHTLIPDLIEDDYRILRDCLLIFTNYIHAISGGILNVKLNFVFLESVDVLCHFERQEDGCYFSVMKNDDEGQWKIHQNVPCELAELTNAWLYIYPDHRKWDSPEFINTRFVTGGCSCCEKPILICDDNFLMKKINDLGSGNYSDEERRIYFPQWLMHEYYHYLFNVAFKEFKLEQNGHDWFDRNFWPQDFVGTCEPEFYDQALRKRFYFSETPIWVKLSGSLGNIFLTVNVKDSVSGRYEIAQVQNDWHIVNITTDGDYFKWTNNAGVSWKLIPYLKEGKFKLDKDCPYFNTCKEISIFPIFKSGCATNFIDYLSFGGERYYKK